MPYRIIYRLWSITHKTINSSHTFTDRIICTRLPSNLHFKFFIILAGRFIILQAPYQVTKFFYFCTIILPRFLITAIRIGLISLPPLWVINKITICICNIVPAKSEVWSGWLHSKHCKICQHSEDFYSTHTHVTLPKSCLCYCQSYQYAINVSIYYSTKMFMMT